MLAFHIPICDSYAFEPDPIYKKRFQQSNTAFYPKVGLEIWELIVRPFQLAFQSNLRAIAGGFRFCTETWPVCIETEVNVDLGFSLKIARIGSVDISSEILGLTILGKSKTVPKSKNLLLSLVIA